MDNRLSYFDESEKKEEENRNLNRRSRKLSGRPN